jgi:hypothetical protein
MHAAVLDKTRSYDYVSLLSSDEGLNNAGKRFLVLGFILFTTNIIP